MSRRGIARVLLVTFVSQAVGLGAPPALTRAEAAPVGARSLVQSALQSLESTISGGDAAASAQGLLPIKVDLGAARRFNGFFFESFTATASDVEGRLAAGTDVSINSYSVASHMLSTASGGSLVVGRNLTFPQGRVFVGDIVVGGSAAGLGQAVRNSLGPNQHVFEHAQLPFNFAQEKTRLEQTSQALAALPANGTFQYQFGGLTLHGDCTSPSQVFALNGQQVLDASSLQLDCIPASATVILNVSGTSTGLTDMSLEALAPYQSTTLFNFHQAQTLTLRGVGIRGSVLAPKAQVSQPQGVVYGTVIAKSWNGPMELHNVPFKGVGAGDFCPLLPIAVPFSLLAHATPGTQFSQVPRGTGAGQFSWLTWAGSQSAPTLAQSLLPPGDSYTYVNPDDNTDWLLSPGDWVGGAAGSMNSSAVRSRLDILIGQEIAVPAWSATRGQGSNFQYQSQDFVRVRLLGYQLTGQGWLSFEFLGFSSCFNRPPTVDAGPNLAGTVPPGSVAIDGSVSDDGLPTGTLTVQWSKLSGPGAVTFDFPQAARTTARFIAPGTYVLRLSANDTQFEAHDDVQVTIATATNAPPVVDAGPDQQIVQPADTVTLLGTATDDGLPAGSVLSLQWSQVSGPAPAVFGAPTAPATTARFGAPGTYVLKLSASDGPLSANDTTTVTVQARSNQRPQVAAGPDQTLILPMNVAALTGSVTDDGVPGPAVIHWSQESGPAGVTFANPAAPATSATLPRSGTYVLRLSANDGEFTVSDDVTVVVEPVIPAISISGASLAEGQQGARLASVNVTLSLPTERVVNVDYGTLDDSAGPCDYLQQAGTLTFEPGQVQKTIVVPVFGDLVVEGDERFFVQLVGPTGGTLAVDRASVTILNDDAANRAPGTPAGRLPLDRSVGVVATPTLSWNSSDPDPGDPVLSDVFLGTSFDLVGQSWSRTCPTGPAPVSRSASASAYDVAADRLIVFGGASDSGATLGDLWVLESASGSSAAPSWRQPGVGAALGARRSASLTLDPISGRALLFGGCTADCASTFADAWMLADPAGIGGPPAWVALPSAPAGRMGHAVAYARTSGRMIVFGGADAAAGNVFNDVWILRDATLPASAAWMPLVVAGAAPPARRDAASAYDAEGDRLFIYGGRNAAGDVLSDTWELLHASGLGGAPEWVALHPSGPAPAARSGAVLAYDGPSQRLVLTAGASADLGSGPGHAFDDTWILNGIEGSSPAWVLVAPGGIRPLGRYLPAAGYSSANARLVLALGANPQSSLGDVWQLSDPIGRLPRVAAGQAAQTFAAGPLPDGLLHFWRVVVRDSHGALQGSTVFRLTPGMPLVSAADVAVVEGHDGTRSLRFTLSLSAPQDTDVSVGWASADGSAVAGEDYLAATGTTTFPAGSTTATVDINVVGDRLPEADESFSLVLSNPIGVVIATTAARGTIVDDDVPNATPQVDAGPDRIVDPGLTILDATVSDDGKPTPAALAAHWSQISGPALATFTDVTAIDTGVTFNAPGVYVLRLTANDGQLSASDDVRIEVRTANAPPIVSAGPDQNVLAPASVASLAGFVTDDGLPAGSALSITWSQVSGPDPVVFAAPGAVTTAVTLGRSGLYVLRLTASDGALSASDEVSVTLVRPNAPPLVSAGPDRSLSIPIVQTQLQGSVSDDGIPGSGLISTWSVVSGPAGTVFANPAAPVTNVTFPGIGSYVLRLSASDGALVAADETTITVSELPDLVVDATDASGVSVDGQSLTVSGSVQAQIRNAGAGPADSFQLAFFEDRNHDGTYEPESDALLGTTAHAGLAPGASATLFTELSGSVLFAGNLVWAFADSQQTVTERNENNNYGSSAPPCVYTPTSMPIAPVEKWAWTSSATVPTRINVTATPAIADLNGDGVPDIVFPSYAGAFDEQGVLRALNGADGSELWSVTDPSQSVTSWVSPAIGDLDGDGHPDIVTFRASRPVAFEHDGRPKWVGAISQAHTAAAPSLADLDGDGHPEIIVGKQVFSSDGTLRWTGTGTAGEVGGRGQMSLVADLDLDGVPEIVAGPTAYRANHGIYDIWWQDALPEGATAVGNFDADPYPEIVLAAGGRVWLLEHTGAIKWGPITFPGGGNLGAPVVADFDGDGRPEIGVAGATSYTVFETDGTIRWSAVTRDTSSSSTGASAFDFDGDGASDVVYRDELNLYVFGGRDGAVLFKTPLSSCTILEYPVVADVDGDGSADIVVPANDSCGYGPDTGLHVFGDAAGRWLATRPIWNQYAYHISNVAEDATIPRHEQPGWQSYNSYRQNTVTSGCALLRPDVTASFVRATRTGSIVSLSARIGNAGVGVGRVNAAFYDGDPRTGGRLLGATQTVSRLETGSFADVTIQVSPAESAYPLWVVADDRGDGVGVLAESNELNNFYEAFDLVPMPNAPPTVAAGPDRTASPGTIALLGQVSDDGLPADTLLSTWTVVSGPGSVSFADAAQPATTVTFTESGTYVLRLSATDGDLSAQDEVAIIVTPGNQPPFVDAGADQAMTLPVASVILQGQATDDGQPSGALLIAWSQVAGPAAVTFGQPTSAVTSVTAPAVGTYLLRLTASDGALSASDDVTLRVGDATSLPDLTVDSLDVSGLQVDDGTLVLSGSIVARVRNVGLAPVTSAFTLIFFEDRNANGVFDPSQDATLGSTVVAALGTGVSQEVTLPLTGTVLFRGNLVHAFADSARVVSESDETNNYGSSAPACPGPVPAGVPFQAVVKWAWTGAGSPLPNSNSVESAPVVADLDLDGIPEVLTVTWPGNSQGTLRALSGRDGHALFTVTDPALSLYWASHLAVGNLDADAYPEIVGVAQSDDRLLAFKHDGTLKWQSPVLESIGYGGPALADLDGDGTPEIVIGRQVLNATNGTLRWTGAAGRTDAYAQLSIVADLDLAPDGRPEVIAGGTAYRANGSTYWTNATIGDGFQAVANFDDDPYPEIVHVAGGQVRLLDHLGEVKWGPVPIPGGGQGGPPTIADFDGDGRPEIGVAGASRYVVFETNGSVRWQSVTQDASSNRTGSSSFDVDGDGAADVVYADEINLRVYRGNDGTVLFQTPMGSSTAVEYPVVADVDADGHAEIVAVGSRGFSGGRSGVWVFGDAGAGWAATRRLWNQHSYHVGNVNDDGSIPAHETPSSSSHNSYRRNLQPTGCATGLADLVAGHLRITANVSQRVLTARVGNAGVNAAAPVPVAFYDGEPFAGGALLGVVSTLGSLLPGQFEDVTLLLPLATVTHRSVWVVADDRGTGLGVVAESNEQNNAYDSGLSLTPGGGVTDLVPLRLDLVGVSADPRTLAVAGSASVQVKDQGDAGAGAFEVTVFADRNRNGAYDPGVDAPLGAASVTGLTAGTTTTFDVSLSGLLAFADEPLLAFVDSAAQVAESDESNNVVRAGDVCAYHPPVGQFAPRVERSWRGSAVNPTSVGVLTTPMVVDLDGDGVPDIVFATNTGTTAGSGPVRAIGGRDGGELFTTTTNIRASAQLAVGDIDGDGRPEIVAVAVSGTALVAFEHDGMFKWTSAPIENVLDGGATIANVDGVGLPEIVVGRQVLNANGTLRWTGTGSSGLFGAARLSSVADLDGDGLPEIIAGNSAYHSNATSSVNAPYWTSAGVSDGWTAIADVDGDGRPEILVTAGNGVWCLEHDGTVKWGPLRVGTATYGAPAAIADFDGDGKPEALISVFSQVALLDGLGTSAMVRWSRPVSQAAEAMPAAFDFDGDGAAEAVVLDGTGLRVLRGTDGAVLAQLPLGSFTIRQGVTVADVDGDGSAEIVTGASEYNGGRTPPGLYVVGDANGAWRSARRVWNEAGYHVTNVNDDGTIPLVEQPSWPAPNSYRANVSVDNVRFGAADLTASYPRRAQTPAATLITVRIGNGGAELAGAGVSVSFYDGDPREGGVLLGTVKTTQDLEPGEYEDVMLTLGPGVYAGHFIWAVADDEGGLVGRHPECDETNNFLDTGLALNEAPVVNAGVDRAIAHPQMSALLQGSVTDDGVPAGVGLSIHWTKVSGPGLALFADPSAPGTSVTFTRGGVYLLRLVAGDSVLVSADEVTITVTVPNQAPDVSAGPDVLLPNSATSYALFGAVTDDGLPSGASVVTTWTQRSGPAPVVFTDANATTTSVTLPATGVYVLRLTASDTVLQAFDDVEVIRTPPNSAPVVSAGADQSIELPAHTATLVGVVTDDGLPLDAQRSYSWTVVSGPGAVLFSGSAALSTQATFGAAGTYVLRLSVSDTELTGSDDVTVVLLPPNQAPTVDARPDRQIQSDEQLTIEGGVNDDGLPLPSSLTVAWSKVNGPGSVFFSSPAQATTSVQFDRAGSYTLRLTASDGVLSGSDDVTINVLAGNLPPVVSAGPDRTQQLPSSLLTLVGSVTDDGLPADGAVSVLWTRVSGPGAVIFATPTATTTQASFTAAGTYVLRLTATDTAATRSDDVSVSVFGQNQAPVVSAGPDRTVVVPPVTPVTLTGSVTDDGLPQGAALTSTWQQISGPGPVVFGNAAIPVTTVTFPALGAYTLRLRGSDSLLSAQDDVVVSVSSGNQPPTVDAGPDQTIVAPANVATLSGSATDDGLPAGESLHYQWSLASGPMLPVFADATSPTTTVALEAPGTYVLRLLVSDTVLSRSDTVSVTLQAAPPLGPAPTVQIATPADGSVVPSPTNVVGTVTGQALQRWTLDVRASGTDQWTVLGTGTTAVTLAPLGLLDPTLLLNGIYELRLSATDQAARTTRTVVRIVVRDNQKVGQFSVSFVDLEVPVAGLPLRVTRTYDSRDKSKGDFGFGWKLDLSQVKVSEAEKLGTAWSASTTPGAWSVYCLSLARSAVVTVTLPDGKTLEFDPALERDKSCWQFAPPGEIQIVYKARPGTVGTLVALDGSRGLIASAWPSPGESHAMAVLSTTDFDYLDPNLYQVTLPDGRAFVVRQGKGLESLTDLSGNQLTVSANGIQYVNPAVAGSARGISFVRDGQGRIQSILDPLGNALTYEYDGNGDLATFKDREQHGTTFTYHPSFPHHLQTIKDPLGRTPIRNDYYDDGRLKSHTDAFGKTITYVHDLSGREEIVTNRTGAVRVLQYDPRGNVVRETDPLGKVVDRTFDTRNNRLTETLPYDPIAPPNPIPKTSYAYNEKDSVLSVTDPKNNRTEYTYDSEQHVLTAKDPQGVYTENTYDTKGRLTKARAGATTLGGPALSETSYAYDLQGNVQTQTVVVAGVTQVTGYTYDPQGNVASETDAQGHSSSYTYDTNGNRKTQTTTRTTSSGTETLVTQYEYDRNGKLTKTTDPDGTFTETVYDELGRQKDTYDKLRHKTSYTYDDMGRITKTTHADGTTEESTYDGEGRRLTSKDRGGKITTYEYDLAGRLTKTIAPDTSTTENHYDAAGRMDWTKDARGKTTFFEYDEAGRRTKVRAPLTTGVFAQTSFTYDANGNQTSVTDPEGQTTDYIYDSLSRLTRATLPALAPSQLRLYTETTYDELGRRLSERDPAGKITQFQYDKLGRLSKVIDAANQATEYEYDELGNRTSQKDAKGHITRFEYDKLGRQVKRILPGGATEQMAYDVAGKLATRTDFMGRVTTYGYDELNRLLSRTYPQASQNVSFTYWPTGRRKTATDSRGTATYHYDQRDRLQAFTYPDGRKLEYVWDGNGNRTSLKATIPGTTPVILTAAYTYDDANRLDLVTDPLARIYDHGYDKNGNRTSLSQPNGTLTNYTYDPMNRLSSLGTTRPSTGAILQSYALEVGPAGNRTKITEQEGSVKQYGYDDLYRLKTETVSGLFNYTKTFVYDSVGNRQTQITTGTGAGTVAYGYDERDRLTLEAVQAYTSDENGNLTSKAGEATYTWDLENRLVRVVKPGGVIVAHVYDVDSNRVQTTTTAGTGTTTTNFLVDTSGSLSQIVAETDIAGTLKTYYVRGDDLLSLMRQTGSSTWQTRYYHSDYIGSIRRLTDEAGAVTDGYSYSAFGEVIGHSGTDPQPYAFTGEPYDPNVGFQYHRARWMDPRTGRFASIDQAAGAVTDPTSSHKYLYAHGEPTRRIDPSGLRSPIPLEVGRAAHRVISAYYALLGAEIDRGPRRGSFLGDGLLGVLFGERWRTDIRFEADANVAGRVLFPGTKGEVYEIKSRKRIREGLADVAYYLDRLATARPEVAWKAGTDVAPFPTTYPGALIHPSKADTIMHVSLEDAGLIVYWFEPWDRDEDDRDQFFLGLGAATVLISAAIASGFAQLQGQIGLSIAVGF